MNAYTCSSLAVLLMLSGCAGPVRKPQIEPVPAAVLALKAPAASLDPAAQLDTLLASDWQRWLVDHPEEASLQGDHSYDDRWTDYRLEAIDERHRQDTGALLKLLEIDRERLDADGQLNFDLYRHQLARDIEAYRHRGHLLAINHLEGVQTADQLAEALQFESVRDYDNWIRRIRGLDAVIEQTMVLLRTGLAEGRTVPKLIMRRVPAQIDQQIRARPDASPLYAPFLNFPASVPEAERGRLIEAAQAAIRDSAVPAFQRLKAMIEQEYLPNCRDSVGLSALPDGRDAYLYETATSTTTQLTPDEIHDIGLGEVARIRGEMEAIRKAVGYRGNLKAFFGHLRSDPKFYVRDGASLLARYRDIAKRIDPELPKLFGRLPRLPYGVRAVPDNIAPDTTTAYYQPGAADGTRAGNFYANLYRPGSRPIWEQEALTAHEAVPGHHLQIALQQESVRDSGGKLPAFRSQLHFTAFIEGWGLYAESLGSELGLYRDPYSQFGRLTYEMWRAVRLVVDTGLHARGWSRAQAIAYFRANTPRSEMDIVNEVDRYIAWPGQALAYKIGELKLKQLRARATETLGPRFDIRGFHDTVLGAGALPLDLLERRVDAWIAARAAAPADGLLAGPGTTP